MEPFRHIPREMKGKILHFTSHFFIFLIFIFNIILDSVLGARECFPINDCCFSDFPLIFASYAILIPLATGNNNLQKINTK